MHPRSRSPDFSLPSLVFGGSFDPIHLGHMALVEGAKKSLPQIEQVIFVPCFESPGKAASVAGPEERLRLLEIAVKPMGALVWDFEVLRPGPSYTIDTLREAHRLGASRDRLFLLLGTDTYSSLTTWKTSDQIRSFAQICVGNRPGFDFPVTNPVDISFQIEPSQLASKTIREDLSLRKIPPNSLPLPLERELERLFLNSKNPYDN